MSLGPQNFHLDGGDGKYLYGGLLREASNECKHPGVITWQRLRKCCLLIVLFCYFCFVCITALVVVEEEVVFGVDLCICSLVFVIFSGYLPVLLP